MNSAIFEMLDSWQAEVEQQAKTELMEAAHSEGFIDDEVLEGFFLNMIAGNAQQQKARYQILDQRKGKVVHSNLPKFDADRIMARLEVEFPNRYKMEASRPFSKKQASQKPNHANYR